LTKKGEEPCKSSWRHSSPPKPEIRKEAFQEKALFADEDEHGETGSNEEGDRK
jgi:hypothetical protein